MHTRSKRSSLSPAHEFTTHTPTRKASRWGTIVMTAVVVLGLTALVVWFLRWDRSNVFSKLIQRTGFLGIGIAIAVMAVTSLLPVPSEFLMVINMKIFGPWWGILYSWVGSMLSAVTTFALARHFGRRLLRMFISEKRIKKVSHWIADRGVGGLILARIVPLPFLVVNYTAGISREVRWYHYVWTSAVGGIPYYIGSALVFIGASHRYTTWLFVGGIALVAIWVGGYLYHRRVERARTA